MITLKGIIDYDLVNFKEPCLTLIFPHCSFKCDKLNNCQVCQNWNLNFEPNITIDFEELYSYYKANPLTKAFCCQGLEPFDSFDELINFISYVRKEKKDESYFVIYTGYEKEEKMEYVDQLKRFSNIIVKWGRYLMGSSPKYDDLLGIELASLNQYGERVS